MTASGRTWTITTTSGYTASGYLPAWAEEDPSRTGVRPERLDIELSGLTHEAAFGGRFMRVCPAAVDPGQDSVVFAAVGAAFWRLSVDNRATATHHASQHPTRIAWFNACRGRIPPTGGSPGGSRRCRSH